MWLAPLAVGFAADLATAGAVIQPEGLRTIQVEAPKFDLDPNVPPARCVVRVEIDPTGAPTATEARACAPKFGAMAEAAVKGWRWAPPTVDGAAVPAATIVAVEFTGRGRVPVAPAERCTYTLRVTGDGRVASTGAAAPQCAIWPLATQPGRVPAVGTCAVAIDGGIVRDTYGWAVPDGCSELGAQVAAAVAGGSLFVEGTASTRLIVETPDPATTSAGVGVDVRGPALDAGGGGRIGGAEGADRGPDPTLAAPDATKAPTVNLAELLEQRKKQPPPPEDPEEEPEDEAPEAP